MGKPSIVLLHGWGFPREVWDGFVPYLTEHFEVVCLNLLGYAGKKTLGEELSLDLMTQHVLKHTPKSAIYLGWSLGGLIAMNIAIYFPKRISALITLSSTPKFIATDNWPGMSSQLFEAFSNSLKTDVRATLKKFISLQGCGSGSHRYIVSILNKLINISSVDDRILQESLAILKKGDLSKKINKIQCPQLYMFGGRDVLISDKVAKKMKMLAPCAHIKVLANAGHGLFLTNPLWCANTIRDFYHDVA